jgi:molybdopterin molybdotransferase
VFWKVGIKPGGPTAFGMNGDKPVFSLPGNPVSTMITFEELVKPALLKMMGHRKVIKPLVKVTLAEDVLKKPGKVNFLRVRLIMGKDGYLASTSGTSTPASSKPCSRPMPW